MEEERKNVEEKKKEIEEERKRIVQEKKELEEKKKLEEERKKLEEERKKIEEERKMIEEKKKQLEEERKNLKSISPLLFLFFSFLFKSINISIIIETYEIDYNNDMFNLKTIAKTILELEKDIKSTIKVQENTEMLLHYNKNNKSIILDDMEDLQNGMTIKVSILSSSQPQSIAGIFLSSFSFNLKLIEKIIYRRATRTKSEQTTK